MEFGPVRVAQKNSMYFSRILVIFSVARLWLNTLYAKVSVRNIREGIFRGNIFRKKKKKTWIPLIFVETIGENISETSCVTNRFIHLICVGMVSFLWFLFSWGKCPASVSYKGLKWWPVWGPCDFINVRTRWELSERFSRVSEPSCLRGHGGVPAALWVLRDIPASCIAPWSHSVWGRSTCWIL